MKKRIKLTAADYEFITFLLLVSELYFLDKADDYGTDFISRFKKRHRFTKSKIASLFRETYGKESRSGRTPENEEWLKPGGEFLSIYPS